MLMTCNCGTRLDDIAAPHSVEHLLLNYAAMEKVQDLADAEVEAHGRIDEWPEHWERSGAIVVWRCHVCERLYFNAKGRPEDVIVYAVERRGLPTD